MRTRKAPKTAAAPAAPIRQEHTPEYTRGAEELEQLREQMEEGSEWKAASSYKSTIIGKAITKLLDIYQYDNAALERARLSGKSATREYYQFDEAVSSLRSVISELMCINRQAAILCDIMERGEEYTHAVIKYADRTEMVNSAAAQYKKCLHNGDDKTASGYYLVVNMPFSQIGPTTNPE